MTVAACLDAMGEGSNHSCHLTTQEMDDLYKQGGITEEKEKYEHTTS